MKKFVRSMKTIAGIAALFGIFACVVGFAAGATLKSTLGRVANGEFPAVYYEPGSHWYIGKEGLHVTIFNAGNEEILGIGEGELNEEYDAGDIHSITADINMGSFRVTASPDDKIHIETESVGNGFTCSQRGGTLVIRYKEAVGTGAGTVTLSLPKNLQLEEAEFSIGAGELDLSGIAADDISLEVGAGEASLSGVRVNNLEIECGVGEVSVSLAGNKDEYSIDVESGVGNIAIDGMSFSGIGYEHEIEGTGDKEISVECGMGKVDIRFEGK